MRREIGAGVCLLLALFGVLGYFGVEAIFIDFLCGLLKGLLGYGFWLMPPALILAAYILFFHRGRPVRLRVTLALLLPLMASCVLHGLLHRSLLPWNKELMGTLWAGGQAMTGGGALGGLLSQVGVQVFSRMGATIVFTMALLFMGLGAFNKTIIDVADWVYNRPRYQYEPEEEPEYQPEPPRREGRRAAPARESAPPRRQEYRGNIDIPVDDGPLVEEQPEQPPQERKRGFFNRKASVPSPDQLLNSQKKVQPPAEPRPEQAAQPEGEVSRHVPVYTTVPAPAPRDPRTARAEAAETAAPVRETPSAEAKIVPEPAPQPEPEPEKIPEPVKAPEPVKEPVHLFGQDPIPPLESEHIAAPAPVPTPEIVREPAVPKSDKQAEKMEAQRAAEEIAQDLQAGLASQEERPYQYPPLSLLNESGGDFGGEALGELNANRQRLSDTIRSFGIDANIINVVRGPSVTRYELELDQGVRLNKLTNLADDIALALGASGVRIAPIPDKISVVGIEVPNKVVSPVSIHSVISSENFIRSKSKTSFAVGKDISGECIVGDINKLPHLLIAGTTGSGKSVCTNTIITSLLYKSTPEEVRLIMVDPKMVELGIYNGIPHLLIPVVTDPKKAAGALQWAVTEMMKRYRTFSEVGVRKLEEYNALAEKTEGMEKMPFIVVLIDELADLMLVAAKEVEESICRVAQMGRAAGMHLVIATQRPSADVITGLMKANIPSRIAFAVASAMESRIILDTQGAEKLVGRGDMLFAPLGSGKPTRVQGCFISDAEVAAVVDFVKRNSGDAQYSDEVMHQIEQNAAEKDKGAKGAGAAGAPADEGGGEYDEMIDAATEVILETGQASVSMLQRRLKLGYARAARLVDQLEEKGIVGPFEGSKPRQLLITKEQWQEMKFRRGMDVPGGYDAPSTPEDVPAYEPGGEDDAPPFALDEGDLDREEEDTL